MKPVRLEDYEDLARQYLPPDVFDYYAGGACDEFTLRENCEAFGRLRLTGRVLREVSGRNLSTRVLGTEIAMPVMIAPLPFQQLVFDDGEFATARAAASQATLMIVSAFSSVPMEDVGAAAPGPLWLEVRIGTDRGATRDVVRRAEDAGYRALVLTVDAQVPGKCERDIRHGLQLPIDQTPVAAALDWNDVAWLVAETRLPVVLKGVLHPDDARLAVAHGASGIFVSNHGGRQLDTAAASIDALESVVEAVDGRAEVYLDGGVRRGTDIVKALALGARAVAVGRPVVWGLAAAGARGVAGVLGILRHELDLALAMCGVRRPDELDRSLLL